MLRLKQCAVAIGEGPCMECPECGESQAFELWFDYWSLRVGALGCAGRFRWLFRCRSCREAWLAKRSLVREFEQAGVPIPFLQRDGLLLALSLLVGFLFLLQ